MNPTSGVSLGLASHLEHVRLTINQNSSPLPSGVPKRHIQAFLDEVVNQEEFPLFIANSPKGAHSITKFLTTYARRNGCSKDDVDARGRWKSNKRIVNTYIDCLILFPTQKLRPLYALVVL